MVDVKPFSLYPFALRGTLAPFRQALYWRHRLILTAPFLRLKRIGISVFSCTGSGNAHRYTFGQLV